MVPTKYEVLEPTEAVLVLTKEEHDMVPTEAGSNPVRRALQRAFLEADAGDEEAVAGGRNRR